MKIYKFRTYEHMGPYYGCNQPGNNTGEYVALADYEALQVSFANLQQQLLIEGHTVGCACVQAASVDCSCGARDKALERERDINNSVMTQAAQRMEEYRQETKRLEREVADLRRRLEIALEIAEKANNERNG